MTFLYDDSIRYDDSPNLDAFGRLRTSSTRVLGEYRHMYGTTAPSSMESVISGNGTLVSNLEKCCFLANVTTTLGDRVVQQTNQYHPYISGTSNKALITFKMDTAKANVQQIAGLIDDNNGIAFRMNGLTPELIIRKQGVDTEVAAISEWNVDRFDGSLNELNPSGVTIDLTKCHILIIDYQWLGVGRVRVGFVINGKIYPAHTFNHANQTTEVYTTQPSLPLRWEIKNTGITSSNTSMMNICGAVYSEGADTEIGITHSISTGANITTVTSTTDGQCLIALKLKDLLSGKPNRALARIKEWSVITNNDVNYKVIIAPNASSIFSATPVWANVSGYSWCEFTKNPSLKAGWAANVNYVAIADGFALGSLGGGSGSNQLTGSFSIYDAIYQNYHSNNSQILAVIVTKILNNADCKSTLRWIEVK